jgi:hypothetical protein
MPKLSDFFIHVGRGPRIILNRPWLDRLGRLVCVTAKKLFYPRLYYIDTSNLVCLIKVKT